jgi:broad specificity phosphatase PhoE
LPRALRLTILCHGATTMSRAAWFPADHPLADGQAARAAKIGAFLGRVDKVLCAPELRTSQTADALGLDYTVHTAFRDIDYGRWAGCTIDDISADEADGLAQWISDPDAAPHGGESNAQLLERMSDWMAAHLAWEGHHVIVTHAAVIRAMIIATLGAPAQAFWKIDVEHLSLTDIRGDGRRWALRSFGRQVLLKPERAGGE